MQEKILLVEDDVPLASLLAEYLTGRGFSVEVLHRGSEVKKRVIAWRPDLVILDLMLPDANGLDICRSLREGWRGPILMLTAMKDDVDVVTGLEIGADDYLGKPVAPRVLLARVRALLRRSSTDLDADMIETGFARREALYLDHEKAVMDQFLTALETRPTEDASPVVIDTTGSVIYTGQAIRQRLRQQTVVVYLSTSADFRRKLHRTYVANPRPVLWQQHFQKKPGEENQSALKRCYKNLLADRDARYRQYAHLEVLCDPTPDQPLEVDTLLAPVRSFLEQRRSSHGA